MRDKIRSKALIVSILAMAASLQQKYGDVGDMFDKYIPENSKEKNDRLIKQRRRQQFKRK